MGPLALNSLEIQGFRVFRRLQIPRLGRVNLITGKNNVGKSCLLEALRLYASRGTISVIQQILAERDEGTYLVFRGAENGESQAIRHLFLGRTGLSESDAAIRIGPLNSPDEMVSIRPLYFGVREGPEGRRDFDPVPPHTSESGRRGADDTKVHISSGGRVRVPGVQVMLGSTLVLNLPLEQDILKIRSYLTQRQMLTQITSFHMPANGLLRPQISSLWDRVALTDREQDVLAALRLVAPQVERVTLVQNREEPNDRVPVVRLAGSDAPAPLRSLGEGMNRLFGLALALVNADGGLLLVDEIESGLHYSVLPDLWRLVFATAQRLQVQVFATTHSWDCIDAFQSAGQQESPEEALLIRLRQQDGDIVPTLFDERKLAIATREQIEIR